jgi:signal transduction histidine kinase
VQRRLRKTIDRLLIRILSRNRGSAQAIRDVHYVREVLRFTVLFSVFVLLPMLALALMALNSLETEAIGFDAGLRGRAEAAASRVDRELAKVFADFEGLAAESIEQGETAVDEIYAKVPAMRAAFRFDVSGEPTWPWARVGPEDTWTEPPASWLLLMREGRRLEAAGDAQAAVLRYDRAAASVRLPTHRATASLAAARGLLRAGDPRADGRLILLTAEHARVREEHGFRVFDLATLLRAELRRKNGDEEGADVLLRALLDSVLARGWPIGLPGDGFVARHTLHMLTDGNPTQVPIAQEQLRRRLDRVFWADQIADELLLVAGHPAPENVFQYDAEDHALWVTFARPNGKWLFSFDYKAIEAELMRAVVEPINQVEPLLTVALVPASDTTPTLVRRSLAPELPWLSVTVRAADPEAIEEQKWWTRTQRRLIILLAVVSGALGLFAAAQLVNRELDTARMKSDFAANVSHELRSPLTQIRLKAESLQLDLCVDDADRQAHYDAIVHETERLSRLIDNVLDFASIERGVKKYMLRSGDLGDVLRKSFNAFRTAAADAGFEMLAEIPSDLPPVWFDRDAIGQVITNLLSNALKYGKWLRLSARAEGEEVIFSVEDHGIGIPPRDLDRIFEHYYRVESADVRRRRGTGIGLTIVQYIVEAHRGTIHVESTLGQGTTFVVVLPTAPPPDAGGP